MNARLVGVMKTAMANASSFARLAAVHPLGQMGKIATVVDGTFDLERDRRWSVPPDADAVFRMGRPGRSPASIPTRRPTPRGQP